MIVDHTQWKRACYHCWWQEQEAQKSQLAIAVLAWKAVSCWQKSVVAVAVVAVHLHGMTWLRKRFAQSIGFYLHDSG